MDNDDYDDMTTTEVHSDESLSAKGFTKRFQAKLSEKRMLCCSNRTEFFVDRGGKNFSLFGCWRQVWVKSNISRILKSGILKEVGFGRSRILTDSNSEDVVHEPVLMIRLFMIRLRSLPNVGSSWSSEAVLFLLLQFERLCRCLGSTRS